MPSSQKQLFALGFPFLTPQNLARFTKYVGGFDRVVTYGGELTVGSDGQSIQVGDLWVVTTEGQVIEWADVPAVSVPLTSQPQAYTVVLKHRYREILGGNEATVNLETGLTLTPTDGVALGWLVYPGGGVAVEQQHLYTNYRRWPLADGYHHYSGLLGRVDRYTNTGGVAAGGVSTDGTKLFTRVSGQDGQAVYQLALAERMLPIRSCRLTGQVTSGPAQNVSITFTWYDADGNVLNSYGIETATGKWQSRLTAPLDPQAIGMLAVTVDIAAGSDVTVDFDRLIVTALEDPLDL